MDINIDCLSNCFYWCYYNFLLLFNGPTIILYTDEANVYNTYPKFLEMIKPYVKSNKIIPLSIKFKEQFLSVDQVNNLLDNFKYNEKDLICKSITVLNSEKTRRFNALNTLYLSNIRKIKHIVKEYNANN